MEVFELIVDEKVSVWRRTHLNVTANSIEEAIDMCLKDGNAAGDCIDSEIIYESEDFIEPSHENPVTLEVMDTNYKTLGTNRE